MYSIHISSLACKELTPFIQFLAVRRRLQQLVVFYVHTWKSDLNKFVGDVLIEQMKEAGCVKQTEIEWFDGAWNSATTKGAELSTLDSLIIGALHEERGNIQIGSAPVHFQFHFESQPDGISYMHEELVVTKEVKNQNLKFFDATTFAFKEAPPIHPMTDVEKYLHV